MSAPSPRAAAARALIALGRPVQAAERLDAMLLRHPFDAAAASDRARIDVARGLAGPRTLERAQRAVRFGRGADELDLLSQVHALRGEPELAAQAAGQADALREAQPVDG